MDPGFVDPNTDNLINIDSGTYQLNIIDDNGCIYDTTFYLITPAPIYANGTPTDVSCYGFADGGINLSTSNGNIPYNGLGHHLMDLLQCMRILIL